MAAKLFQFNHEQHLSHEDGEVIAARRREVADDGFRLLRNAVWAEDPEFVLQADGLSQREAPTAKPEIARTIVSMAEYRERQEQETVRNEQSEADRRAEEARWEAERARRSA